MDRYRLVHPSDCEDAFTVRVWDPAPNRPAHDVDLYLGQGELGTNTSEYEISEDGPDSTESYTVSNVSDGEVWTLLVAHENATETPYGAWHYVDCGSESPDDDDDGDKCLLGSTPGVGSRPVVRAGGDLEGRCSGLPGDWEGGSAGPDPGYGRDEGEGLESGRTGPGVAPMVAGAAGAAAALAAARVAVRRRRGWTVPGVARGRWPATAVGT